MGDRSKNTKKLVRKQRGKSSTVEEVEDIAMGKPRSDTSPCGSRDTAKEGKRKRPVRERFLLTRKTWRYMADAGRRLIPDGAHNRPEDIPKISAYFQEVCQREPRFLLWRKGSYPGALGFRSHQRKNRRKKGGSCREKASSADEAEDSGRRGTFTLAPLGGGRFDLHKLREEFLHGKSKTDSPRSSKETLSPSGSPHLHGLKHSYGQVNPPGSTAVPTIYVGPASEEDEKQEFIETLRSYLSQQDDEEGGDETTPHSSINFQVLLDQLRKQLSELSISPDTCFADESSPATVSGHELRGDSTSHYHHLPSSYRGREGIPFTGDHQQKLLVETLRRYYSKSTSREKVISDLLTDRKMLEKLYFDLRKTRGFSGRRSSGGTGLGASQPSRTSAFSSFLRRRDGDARHESIDEENFGTGEVGGLSINKNMRFHSRRSHRDVSPFSPPPLIEVQNETEVSSADVGTQTPAVPPSMFASITEFLRKEREKEADGKEDTDAIKEKAGTRRRSSVDHDDVSPSVSDTIKRYLRMARKKSLDSDKVDRFKRVNYDRNLRNIKAKGEITKPGDDDGLNKGAQTEESWVDAMKELKLGDLADSVSRIPSSRSSIDEGDSGGSGLLSPTHASGGAVHHHKGLLSTGQTFLSNLLHGLQQGSTSNTDSVSGAGASCVPTAAAAMQKSKSSSSVVQHGSRLMGKKLWRTRSKSQGRNAASVPCSWTPQGRCTWTSVSGRTVTLSDTSCLQLTEPEANVLHQVAQAKLQALNLGVTIRIPSEMTAAVVQKPKRRPYLLKRKALTTGIFDTARGKETAEKEKEGCGQVFGIPLAQCVENDRIRNPRTRSDLAGDETLELRRKSHHGSRSSFSSLIETGRPEESGSCESLMVGSVPGLLDTLSCDSAVDSDYEPAIPQIVSSCFRYLEANGINTLGLFRVSSSKKRVRQLREDFDCGKDIAFGEDVSPHDVATLLKEFFRDLPEPLLSRDLYHAFVQTQRIRNRRLQYEALQHLVQLLPAANRDTLHALLTFLANVAAHSTDYRDHNDEWVSGNKMDSNNLATVFAPNVLHCIKPGSTKEITSERAEERIDVINVVRTMIDHNKNLFHVSAQLLDEVYVHMMDSHPDVLDQLLSKRDASNEEIADDQESSRTEGASSNDTMTDQYEQQQNIVRRVWSREEFLHETAGMGGPDMAMRPSFRHRERERVRERNSKKRWCEETATGRRHNVDQRQSGQEDRPSPDKSGGGIITASLKIPVPSAINLEDTESPYMEDSSYSIATVDAPRQQMTIGIVCSGSTSAPRRRRQRSASGSDSSQASTTTPGPTHASQYQQTSGYDSALGSSATFSSPPRNTTPSICSSSGGEAGLHSSPPSWASSPPTSPDANLSSINFIPDDITTFSSPNQPQNTKMSIGTKGVTASQTMQLKGSGSIVTAKEVAPVILQKVTFTSTSELRQVHRTGNVDSFHMASTSHESQMEQQVQSVPIRMSPKEIQPHHKMTSIKDMPKSVASSSPPTSPATRKLAVNEELVYYPDRKYTTSISSIGGAVMRSKTADIERMLRIQRSEGTAATEEDRTTQERAIQAQEQSEDKKKYTKRRYTDYRHQTRQIPDAEALSEATSSERSDTIRTSSSSSTAQHKNQGPVWKRRELIASDPKEH